jgi:high-affinity K+ transport system ATPase subunit B
MADFIWSIINKNIFMKPVKVLALPDYKLRVSYDDGVSGIIKLADFVKKGIFTSLKDVQLFRNVYVTDSSIAWSDELEIDALAVYAEIVKKEPSEIVSSYPQHATD